MTLNWGFTRVKPVAEKTLFNVSMGIKGQVKMLVKYANPVRFALQTAVSPVVRGPCMVERAQGRFRPFLHGVHPWS